MFEYLVRTLYTGEQNYTKELNELGQQGWEAWDQTFNPTNRSIITVYFKKKKASL